MNSTKIQSQSSLITIREKLAREGRKVIFTNGCFDILHRGHVDYLQKARALGDCLMVGLNSDASVTRLKGPGRPLMPQDDRAFILAGLWAVDYITVFEEDTPLHLISALKPDVLVKGGDYRPEEIVGKEAVEAAGGRVVTIPLVPDRSTSMLIQKLALLTSTESVKKEKDPHD